MTIITEIIPIEGLDLDGIPPCNVELARVAFHGITPQVISWDGLCGKPSVIRVISACISCGDSRAVFTCISCRRELESGKTLCGGCFHPRRVTGYY